VYRIPPDFDPGIFVGARLERVCFGPYIVHFDFAAGESLELTIEGSYEHSSGDGWTDAVRLPIGDSRLIQLTNHEVVSAQVESEERLRLTFDHGHELMLIDDTEQYESFQINHGARLWIF
jgi:hypothetical protein